MFFRISSVPPAANSILQRYEKSSRSTPARTRYALSTTLSYHQYSREAARYCEAAWRLGLPKLLPVMDEIFKDQAQWSQDGSLESSVAKVLSNDDLLKVKKIMQDSSVDEAIEREIRYATKYKIAATPTILISYIGKQQKVEGLITYLVMKQFIDSIVK
jgi:protein-disulfide isomerase